MNNEIWKQYQKGLDFNSQIGLNDTVEENEDFFIGKQWEGVQSNGLPTPVFNFLKRVTLHQVATITSDNINMRCSPIASVSNDIEMERLTEIVNDEFASLFEHNNIVTLIREFLRNAAVDGDGCTYTYFDPNVETGQPAKGAIVTEVIENTRVYFGNPNSRKVQSQPFILIARRELIDDVKYRAEQYGASNEAIEAIVADSDDTGNRMDGFTDDKCTLVLRLRRDRDTGTIHACEVTKSAIVREEYDTGLKLYPITWLNWDYIHDCYHGQALITGLIPNQEFINKAFAMTELSLMTTAFPKVIYDATRIKKWTNQVGASIGVQGGDVTNAVKLVDPAQISPQISQFIELAINYTQSFLGATSAALGDTRPDNTSAIIALQRAAATPSELTKQNLYKSIEDLGRIYIDMMGEYYGKRYVDTVVENALPEEVLSFAGADPTKKVQVEFDFARLKEVPMSMKLDVGASSYWSEVASMQTLDNLLMQNKISLVQYLERIPDGYISKRQELIAELKGAGGGFPPAAPTLSPEMAPEIPLTAGYSALQREINESL